MTAKRKSDFFPCCQHKNIVFHWNSNNLIDFVDAKPPHKEATINHSVWILFKTMTKKIYPRISGSKNDTMKCALRRLWWGWAAELLRWGDGNGTTEEKNKTKQIIQRYYGIQFPFLVMFSSYHAAIYFDSLICSMCSLRCALSGLH